MAHVRIFQHHGPGEAILEMGPGNEHPLWVYHQLHVSGEEHLQELMPSLHAEEFVEGFYRNDKHTFMLDLRGIIAFRRQVRHYVAMGEMGLAGYWGSGKTLSEAVANLQVHSGGVQGAIRVLCVTCGAEEERPYVHRGRLRADGIVREAAVLAAK